MNRIMILAMALVVAVAGMAAEADAGLFNRNKCCKPKKCRRAKTCCTQTCEPVQTCCAPAPTCCEPAPAPCAAPAPAPCGCAAAPAPSCGCEVQTCGCEAPAPSCGCEAQTCGCETNCNCLSRRQLRRANRKGQCCGAEPNTCNVCSTQASSCGCSAPVSTCGCEAAAPAGCSSCGEGVIIESAPAPAGEEAAPEAPESTT